MRQIPTLGARSAQEPARRDQELGRVEGQQLVGDHCLEAVGPKSVATGEAVVEEQVSGPDNQGLLPGAAREGTEAS